MPNSLVSVVLPVFRNARTLEELTARIRRAVASSGHPCEIVCVNDACPEGSLAVLERMARAAPDLTVVDLVRNVGQHRAVLAGMTFTRGDWIAVMDADLQDPPEALPRLLDRARERDAVVFAGRRGCYESPGRLASSRLFKACLAVAAGVPRDAGMFFVAPRRVKDRLLALRVRSPYVVAMLGVAADRILSDPVERSRTLPGDSGYSSFMRLRVGVGAVECALRCRLTGPGSGAESVRHAEPVRSVLRGSEERSFPVRERRCSAV